MHQLSRNIFFFYLIGFMAVIASLQCSEKEDTTAANKSVINTAHLDGLYEERVVNGDTVGIVHIYSEFPDYKWKGDDDEGDACVDDASRAAIFYLRQYQKTSEPEYLRKGQMLIKFLLAMQAPNSYYYNFLWPDGRIHTDGITSKPEPNFWSWRVLWAFGEAVAILPSNDPLVNEINQQREKLVRTILAEPNFRTSVTDTTLGWTFPTWLPKISGTDQASIIMIGLTAMLQQMSDNGSINPDSIESFMKHFADGITMMQIEQPDSLHDGAFLSWENLWHAYGNIQSYGLLMAGEAINDQHMIAHAMYEIDHFYPAVLKAGGLEHFYVKIEDEKLSRFDTQAFSQIAYGRRPMIWAAVKAFQMTKEEKYLSLAKELTKWFSGDNPAQAVMYDPETGRGYDGISNSEQINKNAGAESTIESLLALQVMEEYK